MGRAVNHERGLKLTQCHPLRQFPSEPTPVLNKTTPTPLSATGLHQSLNWTPSLQGSLLSISPTPPPALTTKTFLIVGSLFFPHSSPLYLQNSCFSFPRFHGPFPVQDTVKFYLVSNNLTSLETRNPGVVMSPFFGLSRF